MKSNDQKGNDQRSTVKNPNSKEFDQNRDNRSNQKNPNHQPTNPTPPTPPTPPKK